MLFNDTITVYNFYNDTWQRTVVKGVQFSAKVVKTVGTDGKLSIADTVNITISESAICDREYIDYHDFRKLSIITDNWTLNPADNQDLVIYGEISQDITSQYKIKNLKKDYNALTVMSVSDNRNKTMLKNIKAVCA